MNEERLDRFWLRATPLLLTILRVGLFVYAIALVAALLSWTPPPALSRHVVPFLMVVWARMAVTAISYIVGVAFGQSVIGILVQNVVYVVVVPLGASLVLRHLKQYPPEWLVSRPPREALNEQTVETRTGRHWHSIGRQ